MSSCIRLGYPALNITLRDHTTGRTCRVRTAHNKGKNYLEYLARKNLEDLLVILQWNEDHGIRFYRISSGICPHITNPELCNDPSNWRELAYSLGKFQTLLTKIGEFAKKYNHRLTFHPDPFITLGTQDESIRLRNLRELYFHSKILDKMNLDNNSIICIHGGGVYKDKKETMRRWVENYKKLPEKIKSRLALENDEFSYSLDDVLELSDKVDVPVIADLFHYTCYEETARKKNIPSQTPLKILLPRVVASWKSRQIKIHIAQQKPGAVRGAHDFYTDLPEIVKKWNLTKQLDIMVEAKCKELVVFDIWKKNKDLNFC